MIDYENINAKALGELKEMIERIEAKIDPVVDAYRTAGTIGLWLKRGGTGLLLLLSIIWTWLKIKSGSNG